MFWIFNIHLNKKFDKIDEKFNKIDEKFEDKFHKLEEKFEDKFNKLEEKLDKRFDKLEEKVTDIDRLYVRLEGAFSAKECCAITTDKRISKAE